MTARDLPDGELGGLLSWWSIQHLPPATLPAVFAGFRRALAPGGHLLIAFHAGDDRRRPETAYGHPVCYDTHLLPPGHVAGLLGAAGFTVTASLRADGERWPWACLLAKATSGANTPT